MKWSRRWYGVHVRYSHDTMLENPKMIRREFNAQLGEYNDELKEIKEKLASERLEINIDWIYGRDNTKDFSRYYNLILKGKEGEEVSIDDTGITIKVKKVDPNNNDAFFSLMIDPTLVQKALDKRKRLIERRKEVLELLTEIQQEYSLYQEIQAKHR